MTQTLPDVVVAGSEPWHICDHCIAPTADGLYKLVEGWNRTDGQPPESRRIDRIYDATDVDFATEFLKIHVSVSFARDFHRHLYAPLRRLHRLEFRACKVLTPDDKSDTVVWCMDAINRVIRARIGQSREFDEELGAIEHEFRASVRYLWRVSVILAAKIADRQLTKTEVTKVPPHWNPVVEARNGWIYDECMKGVEYSIIIRELQGKPKSWPRINSTNGIKDAAKDYAVAMNRPLPPTRQPGRRTRRRAK